MRILAILSIMLLVTALDSAAQKIEVLRQDLRPSLFTRTITVPEGQVLEIVDFFTTKGRTAAANQGIEAWLETDPAGGLPLKLAQARAWTAGSPLGGNASHRTLKLVGPITARIKAGETSHVEAFLYYRITPNVDTQSPQSSQTVVIPEDADGEVEIILESSNDLVTWVAANPGRYDPAVGPRFFRIRAVNHPPEE